MSITFLLIAGCEPAAATRVQITGGVETAAHPAVGALIIRRTRCDERPVAALCTVALIAPAVVVTAGHCIDAYRDRQLEVSFGARLGDPEAQYRVVVGRALHPRYDETSSDYDIALLALSSPIEIAPIALQVEPLDESWVGREVVLVGFGESETGDGAKREGTAIIESVDALTFRYGPAPAMTCRGDSGGPALSGGLLLGVTSAGDVECAEWGIDARIDAHRAEFLEPAQAALARPPPPALAPDALCEAECTGDEDCPSSFECRSDETMSRCAPPQGEPGSFTGSCTTDSDCASGSCAPLHDDCACRTPCALPDPPAGCAIGRPTPSTWLLALALCALVRRRRIAWAASRL